MDIVVERPVAHILATKARHSATRRNAYLVAILFDKRVDKLAESLLRHTSVLRRDVAETRRLKHRIDKHGATRRLHIVPLAAWAIENLIPHSCLLVTIIHNT